MGALAKTLVRFAGEACIALVLLFPAAVHAEGVDQSLVDLSAQLDVLLAGELPESVPVSSLFGVRLDDLAAVAARTQELATLVDESSSQLADMQRRIAEIAAEITEAPATEEARADDPNAEPARSPLSELERERAEIAALQPAANLRLQVAKKRLVYLTALDEHLGRMTEASRRILPSLGESGSNLRAHSEGIVRLAEAIEALALRVAALGSRSASGMLVGFVSEQRELTEDLAEASASYEQQAGRLRSLATEMVELGGRLEDDGRMARAAFLRAVAQADGQRNLDELFLSHIRSQRRLRKSVSQVLVSPGRDALDALTSETERLAGAPDQIGTTGDARQALEFGVEHRSNIDSLIAAETAGMAAWELAFKNGLVTVLSEQASTAARAGAYGFSGELVDDVRSELGLALDRTRDGLRQRRAQFPNGRSMVTSAAGQAFLLRVAALLAILGTWLYTRRQTPRITVTFVKALARMRSLRPRVGLLVRWSGLIQSALPSVLGLIGLQLALLVTGETGPAGQILRAVLLPILIYTLGLQLLTGATRRITPGRPALIELRPSTLERLQRTYATIGIVVASAYVIDGVARVVIGAGRVVALVRGLVILWVAVWAIWETLRWRMPLAQRWSRLVQADPPPREARLAQWMEAHRLGFVLSPIALLRVAGSPLAKFVGELATGTNFVQSLRARLLRRRSKQAEAPAGGNKESLPPEYLEAFPLYPILGEDDSLLVTRDSILDEVSEQWKRWSGTRTDGSLVIIGEKGAGKTTLAAQISRRVKGANLVQHTIQGKPTTSRELLADLTRGLGGDGAQDVAELSKFLCEGEERVIVLDEAHNVFLRHVDGYGAYDALVDLVNETSSNVFWVLVFNSFTWRFLNESRSRVHYFRKLLNLPRWTPEEIQRLIGLRNKKTGFDLHFDEVLLSDSKSSSESLELVEEAEGYFRLLWESSGGNPRIATQLWLSSLTAVSDKTLGVGLFPEQSTDTLSSLQDDLIFALAAICQHENLSSHELGRVLNMPEGFSRFAVRFLSESGFIEAKDTSGDRYTLAPAAYRAVLRVLRSRHLLYD